MITSRFFIENKEIIGLWMLYAIVMWLGVCILDYIFDSFKQKRNKKIARRKRIEREIKTMQNQNWKIEFQRNFERYVVDFEI